VWASSGWALRYDSLARRKHNRGRKLVAHGRRTHRETRTDQSLHRVVEVTALIQPVVVHNSTRCFTINRSDRRTQKPSIVVVNIGVTTHQLLAIKCHFVQRRWCSTSTVRSVVCIWDDSKLLNRVVCLQSIGRLVIWANRARTTESPTERITS